MCRYAMANYKPHYACFECRKTFKRRLMHDINRDDKQTTEAKCPQCGQLMADMGLDFEAPKKEDSKAWAHIKTLYTIGITFHSCGCSGPGYIPRSTESLITYLYEQKETALQHLNFWRARVEPTTSKEYDKDKSKNGDYIYAIPYEIRGKKGVSNEEAINFWISRLKELESNIEAAKLGR